jgi:putative membrane protein
MHGLYGLSGSGWGAGIGMGSGVVMLFFWALVIVGTVCAVRYVGRGPRADERQTPLDILKKRYARGEIAREDFERTKAEIER